MKYYNLIFVLFIIIFTACGKDDESSIFPQSPEYGTTTPPGNNSIAGKTLTFYKSNGDFYFSAIHYSDGVTLSISSTDYAKYPPSYSFSYLTGTTATYNLTFTTKTYIPYYQTYNYAKFQYKMKLTFTSSGAGSYQADYYNANGLYQTLNGKFTLN